MEPVGRLLAKSGRSRVCVTPDSLIRGSWARAVGKIIASHTNVVALYGTLLVVEAEDSVWQSQLYTLRHQIRQKLEKAVGQALVGEIEFRVMVPRRQPARAERRTGTLAPDEADAIQDPVLQRVYRAARKRASA